MYVSVRIIDHISAFSFFFSKYHFSQPHFVILNINISIAFAFNHYERTLTGNCIDRLDKVLCDYLRENNSKCEELEELQDCARTCVDMGAMPDCETVQSTWHFTIS